MIKIIIEKKAKYAIISLCILVFILAIINAKSTISADSFFSNTLAQVVKSANNPESVDSNNNGLIDEAEKAYGVNLNNIQSFPLTCAEGTLMIGFNPQGVPICATVTRKCAFDPVSLTNKCSVMINGIANEGGAEPAPRTVSISLIPNMTKTDTSGNVLKTVTYSASLKNGPVVLNNCQNNSNGLDKICLTYIELTTNTIQIKATYEHIGADTTTTQHIYDISITGTVNSIPLKFNYKITGCDPNAGTCSGVISNIFLLSS